MPGPAGYPRGTLYPRFDVLPGVPMAPIVSAVGVTGLTETSVTLVGSVDTVGEAGTWFFTWGSTTGLGTAVPSASAAASASVFPQTVTADLTGLTPGATYYFAVIAATALGTVQSATLSFMTQNPTVPATTLVTAQSGLLSSARTPHFAWPFRITYGTAHIGAGRTITSHDGAAVVEQDSDGDVVSCVDAIASCTVSEWPENPSFGLNDLLFKQAPLDVTGVATDIVRWEPRASLDVTSVPADQAHLTSIAPDIQIPNDDGSWVVQITVQTAS